MDTDAYQTTHLYLASYLHAKQYALIGQERYVHDGRKYIRFSFRKHPELSNTVKSFWNDGPIGVSTFCRSLNILKGIIRNEWGIPSTFTKQS